MSARWAAGGFILAVALAASAILLPPAWQDADSGSAPMGLIDAADRQGADVRTIATTPLVLRGGDVDPQRTAIIVAGADRPYSSEEAAFMDRFVQDGGRILVAEEDGSAGSLLAAGHLGFERAPMLHADGAVPLVFHLGDAERPVVAAAPTALILEDGSAFEVVAWSDPEAILDRDGDGTFGAGDPAGPFPVAAQRAVGDAGGAYLVIASLDVLAVDAPDAAGLQEEVAAWLLPNGGALLLDESHQNTDDPALRAVTPLARITSESPVRWAVLAAAGVAAAAALLLTGRNILAWAPHRARPPRFRSRQEVLAGAQPVNRDETASAEPRRAWTAGAGTLSAAVLLASVGGWVLGNPQAAYGGVAGAALLASAAWHRTPHLEATRRVEPHHTVEGRPVDVEVEVRGGRGAVRLRDGVPAHDEVPTGSNIADVRLGHQPVTLRYTLSPSVRGVHVAGPLRVRATDPFGLLIDDRAVGEAMEVEATPRAQPLDSLVLRVRRPDLLMGAHSVNRAGDGTQFHALREYQTGDSLRMVNWRASARSKGLMVNQRVMESKTDLTLVLDARAVAEAGDVLETPLTLGARIVTTLADVSLRSRDRVRLLTYGEGITEIPPAPGKRFSREIASVLGRLPARGDMPFAKVADRLRTDVRPGTPLVLVSGLENDASLQAGIRTLVAYGIHVLVLRPPVSVAPDETGIASACDEMARRLRSSGATVLDLPPGVPLEDVLRIGGVL